MPTILPARFAIDYTGDSPDNLVVGEPHVIPVRNKRVVAPLYGPFFKRGLSLFDTTTQQIIRNEQYHCFSLIQAVTEHVRAGDEVYDFVVITDPSVSTNVEMTYQSVGGHFTQAMDTTTDLLEILYADDRPARWPNIINSPEFFNPTPHPHNLGEGVGFEWLLVAIERLRMVILLADSAGDDVILKYIDDRIAAFESLIVFNTDRNSQLGKHIANDNPNPHNLTKAQLNLGNVKNYPLATLEEAIAGNLPNRYMTPSLTKSFVSNLLAYHFNNHNNPHQLTKADIDLTNIENYGLANAVDIANANADTPKYVTNVALKGYLDEYLPSWKAAMLQQITQVQADVSVLTSTANSALSAVQTDLSNAVTTAGENASNALNAQTLAAWCNTNVQASEQLARSLFSVYVDSYSLMNWVPVTLTRAADWRDITYGNGKFVMISQGTSNIAAYSLDGINWQNSVLPSSTNWISVAYGNGVFVAISTASNQAATSADGVIWELRSLPVVANWHDITYGNGRFVAVAYGLQSVYSTDGITWASGNMPSIADWVSVSFGLGKFMAIARGSNKSAVSSDGSSWSAVAMSHTDEWTAITFGNGRFMAAAALGIVFSTTTDATTWVDSPLPTGLNLNWQSITYGDGKFFALAYGEDKAVMSLDGLTWSARQLTANLQWIGCAYGNDKFVSIAKDSSLGNINQPLPTV